MKRTYVSDYRLLLSLSNKLILFGSHYWSPCICFGFYNDLFQILFLKGVQIESNTQNVGELLIHILILKAKHDTKHLNPPPHIQYLNGTTQSFMAIKGVYLIFLLHVHAM